MWPSGVVVRELDLQREELGFVSPPFDCCYVWREVLHSPLLLIVVDALSLGRSCQQGNSVIQGLELVMYHIQFYCIE